MTRDRYGTKGWQFSGEAASLLLIIGAVGLFGSGYLSYRFHQSLPTRAAPSTGRIYPNDEHGRYVYLTHEEHFALSTLQWIAGTGLALGSLLHYRQKASKSGLDD